MLSLSSPIMPPPPSPPSLYTSSSSSMSMPATPSFAPSRPKINLSILKLTFLFIFKHISMLSTNYLRLLASASTSTSLSMAMSMLPSKSLSLSLSWLIASATVTVQSTNSFCYGLSGNSGSLITCFAYYAFSKFVVARCRSTYCFWYKLVGLVEFVAVVVVMIMSCRAFCLIFCLLTFSLVSFTQSANILMITMGGTKSHKIPFWALAKALITRGHAITFLNGFEPDFYMAGLDEITPKRFADYIQNYTNWDLAGARYAGQAPLSLFDAVRYPSEACNSLLSDPATQRLLLTRGTMQQQQQRQQFTSKQLKQHEKRVATMQAAKHTMASQVEKFHLAIVDGAFPECALGILHRLNVTTVIYINTVGFYTGSISLAGNPIAYAVTPHVFGDWTQTELQFSFLQRVRNCITHVFADILHAYCMHRVHQVLRTQLDDPQLPHPYLLARDVAFILQNGHPSVSYVRPHYPNVAEVACLHCRPAKSLDGDDIGHFMDTAPDGVILFSLGSSVRASRLPIALLKVLVSVFARLPQYHVLWKWHGDSVSDADVYALDDNATGLVLMSDLPVNVRLSEWLPQQDVLGHRKLKLFITHGGLLSMYEAIYHAVPLVMLPVFCDHDANAAKALEDGYALRLSLTELDEEQLFQAVHEVLHNDRYRRAVRRRRALLRDQPMSPLRSAVYWTEFVLRHRGARHLQAAGRHMSYFVYQSFDVIGFLLALPISVVFILYKIVKFIRELENHL